MLKLYHGATSVCSIKARIALSEKELNWESELLDLRNGDQFKAIYVALNPESVVPTLVHDGLVVRESSVIIDYLDGLDAAKKLMPESAGAIVCTRLWLIRCIEIHAAINTMSFATAFREKYLQTKTAEEIEASLLLLPNRQIAAKRRDLFAHGARSVFVDGALHTLDQMLNDMHVALKSGPYLVGKRFGLADIALIAYVDRLDRLALSGLWNERFPLVGPWLERMRSRSSYATEVLSYIPEQQAIETRAAGARSWSDIAARL